MISFRQHAISLAAVFLALALGLFLGSGFVGDQVNSLTGASRDRLGDLEEQRDQLNQQVNAANSFDAAIAPRLLAGTLDDQSVLVVTAPDTNDADVDAVKEYISTAGGGFAGQIGLTTELLRDENAEQLRSIVDNSIPGGVTLRADYTDSGARIGDLIGALTLSPNGTRPASPADRSTGLQALREGGFITFADNAITSADLVVVMTGGELPEDSGAQGQLTARVAGALATRAEGGVLAGRSGSANGGSAIARVRADPAMNNTISTVDDVQAQTGRITTVLALDAELAGQPSGAFGTGPGATAITVGAQERPSD